MFPLNLSMEDLPIDIIVDILSRLPVKTIIHCKCVCSYWQNLIIDSDFANFYLSRSPAGLMIYSHTYEGILKWVEIEDEVDRHHFHYDPVMTLDLNRVPIFKDTIIKLVGSVNGLICLWECGYKDDTYICNPITREYLILPRLQYHRDNYASVVNGNAIIVYGFGVGIRTKEYKVVRIFYEDIPPDPISLSWSRPRLLEAEVYTLGTRQWRSLGLVPYWLEGFDGPFLNGHVHWIVLDEDSPEKLCCFNFDKETFKLFPSPPSEALDESHIRFKSLAVLKGCLCQSTFVHEFTIWVMKEYGIKKSWHKEVVIKQSISPDIDWQWREPVYLIDGLKDGTLLMLYYLDEVFAYCPQRETFERSEFLRQFDPPFFRMAYKPGFLRLQNFKLEGSHEVEDLSKCSIRDHTTSPFFKGLNYLKSITMTMIIFAIIMNLLLYIFKLFLFKWPVM